MYGDDTPVTFDGFISYSHAADDLLAPRLQAGLQKFAKPWWKRRAVRIFRDESSLAANPHLWSSITEALEDSSWFVLLLSEDAASSEWVGKEIEHWVANKDSDRILPVVTDGDFTWENNDVAGSSVPPALHGVFSEEPRWVDLRFARGDEHLDLQNPDFSAAVADIASTIRGVPKDELASEEVRQHRRTVRTAWAAGIAVTVLAIAAVVAGVFAIGQRNDAQDNAELAQTEAARANQEADRAEEEADRANQEADRANTNADEATRNAQLAKARELAASAILVSDDDPELATLLSLEALSTAPPDTDDFVDALISLRRAVDSDLLVDRIDIEGEGRVGVDFAPDGSALIVASEANRSVSRLPVDSLSEPDWVYEDLTTNDSFVEVSASPDGMTVAVIVVNEPFGGDPGPDVALDDKNEDEFPGRVLLLDAESGGLIEVVPLGACLTPVSRLASPVNQSGYSPDGSYFTLVVDGIDCEDPESGGSVLLETAEWTEVGRFGDGGELSFVADGSAALVNYPFLRTELISLPSLELTRSYEFEVRNFPPRTATISPDGSILYAKFDNLDDTRPSFWDADSGTLLAWGDDYRGTADNAVFLPDGLVLVTGADADVIYDPATGLKRGTFNTEATSSAAVNIERGLVTTGSADGTIELWNVGGESAIPLIQPGGLGVFWINPNWLIEGERTAMQAMVADPSFPEGETEQLGFVVLEPQTGSVELQRPFADSVAQLADGRFVSTGLRFGGQGDEEYTEMGPLMIWDPEDGSETLIQDCVVLDSVKRGEFLCPDGDPRFENVVVSPAGDLIAGWGLDPSDKSEKTYTIKIWDSGSLEEVGTISYVADDTFAVPLEFGDGWLLIQEGAATLRAIDVDDGSRLATLDVSARVGELSRDAGSLFIGDNAGRVWEYDTRDWSLVRDWQAVATRVRGIGIAPDASRIAISGEDGLINIWDLSAASPLLVDRIPTVADRVSDVIWLDDSTIGAALATSFGFTEWQVISLDASEVADEARRRLIRSFTTEECDTYRVDPCPTLDEISNR